MRHFNRPESNHELMKQVKRILQQTHIKLEDAAHESMYLTQVGVDNNGQQVEVLSITNNNDLDRQSNLSKSRKSVKKIT